MVLFIIKKWSCEFLGCYAGDCFLYAKTLFKVGDVRAGGKCFAHDIAHDYHNLIKPSPSPPSQRSLFISISKCFSQLNKMAFNFNWSPLIADTVRARDLLTNALNKSPKPPIIVDDILVTELNLGTKPPDLEILEIGDLADDRFRGIFKMSYDGDAFLTLKTRVQANPLNTYLSTKPSFTSPQPLAAASGLTIPLQITLSDIRLSGFVILVFSKQKGLTLVFRNDPLESLKVSSTFDSIPFVRDYLQREIEAQLRLLFMEDLPAILHKLSLRLFVKDYAPDLAVDDDDSVPIDPLASPPQDPTEPFESSLTDDSIPFITLNNPQDTYISFSQKNLQHLASLSDAQQTLSVSTPNISNVVYRAWATSSDRGSGIHTPLSGRLSRANSSYTSSTHSVKTAESEPTRPTLSSASSYSYSRSNAGNPRKKRKHRVIDLRSARAAASESGNIDSPTSSVTPEPTLAPSSAPSIILSSIPEEQRVDKKPTPIIEESTPKASTTLPPKADGEEAGPPPAYTDVRDYFNSKPKSSLRQHIHLKTQSTTSIPLLRSISADSLSLGSGMSGGILEQAWMRKMAREIARKVDEEQQDKHDNSSAPLMSSVASSSSVTGDAPPAYVS
jgi:distribution and morphology protein 34